MVAGLPETPLQHTFKSAPAFAQVDAFDPAVWDSGLERLQCASWYQSSHYNEYKREYRQEEPVYWRSCDEAGEVLAQAVALLTHPYEWGLYRRGLTGLSPLIRKILPVLICNQAPTVFDQRHTTDMYSRLGGHIAQVGRSRGCLYARIVPSFYQDSYVNKREDIRATLQEVGYSARKKATLVVDLQPDLDELFANLKKDARNKVRKAKKQGVQVVEVGVDDESLSKLQQVMAETSLRNGVPPLSLQDLKASPWRLHYSLGYSRAFVTEHEGHLVSSQMAVVFNGVVVLGGVSYTDYSRQHNIYGNDLMQWHLIEWGKQHGLRLLDFAGLATDVSSTKLKGIYEFKTKWGGRRLDYDEFTIDFPSAKSRMHQLLLDTIGAQLKKWERKGRAR
jgi:hypothetical protein